MKGQEGPAIPRSKGEGQAPSPSTGQWDRKVGAMDDEFGDLEEATDKVTLEDSAPAPRPPTIAPLIEPFVPRERRATVISAIPAQLAKSMGEVRDPAAPAVTRPPVTRPVADAPANPESPPHASGLRQSGTHESVDTYSIDLDDEPNVSPKEQVELLIERARGWIEVGNLGAAVIAADQAMAEAAQAQDLEVATLIKGARPLFDKIFAAYVGLLGEIPVRARSDEQIAGQELGDRTRYLLSSIDGSLTLEQLASTTGIPPVEAMKIAASLLAAGIIRVN